MTDLFSDRAKEKLGLEKIRTNNQAFAEMVGTTLKSGAKLEVVKVSETLHDNTARVSLKYQDQHANNSIRLDFELSRVSGAWKIDNINSGDSEALGWMTKPSPDSTPQELPPIATAPPQRSSSPLPQPPSTAASAPISGGVLNGKAISLPQPPYPPVARAAKASGTVVVQVLIDENGNVVNAAAVSGHPLLRAASVAAARSAKFSPTKLSGQPVKVSGVVTYNFAPQ